VSCRYATASSFVAKLRGEHPKYTFRRIWLCRTFASMGQDLSHCFSIWMLSSCTKLGGSLVTTSWRVLRLQIQETASSYGAYPQIHWISGRRQPTKGGPSAWWCVWSWQPPAVRNKIVTKHSYEPRTRTYYLDKRPKWRNMDMRFGTWTMQSSYRAGSLITMSKNNQSISKM
jgi:hypothetical protein